MSSAIGDELSNAWSKMEHGGTPWGGVFRVQWISRCDLPFPETIHIRNPLNDNKPVKISRDGQVCTAVY